MSKWVTVHRVFYFLLFFVALFFIDGFTLIPIWKESASSFIAYSVNMLFVFGISLIIVIFFIDDRTDEENVDIDSRELEKLYNTLQEIASVDGQIPIQALAKTWQEKDSTKKKIEKLLERNDVDVDFSQLNIYWRNSNSQKNEVQVSDQFISSFTVETFDKVNAFIKELAGKYNVVIDNQYKPYLDMIMHLFRMIDSHGSVPSIIGINPSDPDVMKKNIPIANSNQYDLLSQISLIDHTSRVVKNVISICKKQNCSLDIFIMSVISALAHDIGKVPSYYSQVGQNNLTHPQVSAEIITNSISAQSINDKILSIIVNSILSHHDVQKISGLSDIDIDLSKYAKSYISILKSETVPESEIQNVSNVVFKILIDADKKARRDETKIMQDHLDKQTNEFSVKSLISGDL